MEKNLKNIRESLDFTQSNFADKLGVKLPAYRNYEYGQRDISKDIVIKLLKEFNVNLNYLFTGEGEMFNTTSKEVSNRVDINCLQDIIATIEEYFREKNLSLPPDKKAELIATIYDMFINEDLKEIKKSNIIRFCRIAS